MPEATKSEGFGGSHKTFMVVPQVIRPESD